MNEYIFHNIDNDNIAYWLGFIAADGSVSKTKNQLEIGLSSKDREHLEAFCDFLDIDKTIIIDRQNKCKDKYYPVSIIHIYNKTIKDDLALYGIVPDKSHKNIDFLSYIPDNYKMPFIIGYLDGDGWFMFTDKSHGFGFCGNQSLISNISSFLKQKYNWKNFNFHQDSKSKITYNLQTSSINKTLDFLQDYLSYSNTCDLLKRKQNKAIELLSFCVSHKSYDSSNKAYKKCLICKTDFHPLNDNQKYCCQECAHKANYRCEHPDKETLFNVLKDNNGNFTKVGILYNVSDNTIRKWCKKVELPYHSKDYK